jgi:hypothetical protein
VIIDVADEDLSGIELKAHLGASISGVVTIEGANDTKFPGTFNDSYVSALLRNLEGRSGEGAFCKIGPNGGFRLNGLRAGEYLLDVSAQGISRRLLAIQRVEVAGQLVRGAIELKEGQSVSDARIILAYGDGVVRGRIRFQNGEPPKNLCFYVTADRKGDCDECRANIHSPVSAGGQYMLEGLPPGDYELTLYAQSCGIGVMPPIAPIKQMARVANGVETRADFVVDLNKKDR